MVTSFGMALVPWPCLTCIWDGWRSACVKPDSTSIPDTKCYTGFSNNSGSNPMTNMHSSRQSASKVCQWIYQQRANLVYSLWLLAHSRAFQVLAGTLPQSVSCWLLDHSCHSLVFSAPLGHSLSCHRHRDAHLTRLFAALFWLTTFLGWTSCHQSGIWLESHHHSSKRHM